MLLNDVVFATHALIACILTGLQCFIYEVPRNPTFNSRFSAWSTTRLVHVHGLEHSLDSVLVRLVGLDLVRRLQLASFHQQLILRENGRNAKQILPSGHIELSSQKYGGLVDRECALGFHRGFYGHYSNGSASLEYK